MLKMLKDVSVKANNEFKINMKSVNEYVDSVPGKHSYLFDILWDRGHVAETNVQTACHLTHRLCIMQCRPGIEPAMVIDKLSPKPSRPFYRRLESF